MTEAHKFAGINRRADKLFNLPDYRDAVTAAVLASAPEECTVTVHSAQGFPWWLEVRFTDGSVVSVYDSPWGIDCQASHFWGRRVVQGQICYLSYLPKHAGESMPAEKWLQLREQGKIQLRKPIYSIY